MHEEKPEQRSKLLYNKKKWFVVIQNTLPVVQLKINNSKIPNIKWSICYEFIKLFLFIYIR